MNRYGFARVAACSPTVAVGDPEANKNNIYNLLVGADDCDVVVFPELCITGYTCRDLFRQRALLVASEAAVLSLMLACPRTNQLVIVGAPVPVGNELFNCAVVMCGHKILGVVPKQNIPNYNEFEESRWFRSAGGDEPKEIVYCGTTVPFGIDLLFRWAALGHELVVGVEVCEDLWMPIPPSSRQAVAGANVLVNISASNETVAKKDYRIQLVGNQSGRCVAGYVYASAGPSESTTDLVFGGHCIVAENSHVLAESASVGDHDDPLALGDKAAVADIDVERLQTERRLLTSFGDATRQERRQYRVIPFTATSGPATVGGSVVLKREVNGRPFIPTNNRTLDKRCAEVFGIQCAGLYKRLRTVGWPNVYIGVSGGLDSTLALLATARAFKAAGQPLTKIHGITMPGYGTTGRTKKNAVELMTVLGISQQEIDIRAAALQAFKDMKHDPFDIGMFTPPCETDKYTVECFTDTLSHLEVDDPRLVRGDLVFENVQARLRTFYLMSKGFVIGTGDLSELALGWCTYNGDHMSMYNPNCSVPKTLVQFLVGWVAEHEARKIGDPCNKLYAVLMDIVSTTISPELLPTGKDGESRQSTEDVLGPYELHDFFLPLLVRCGFSPDKILFLSDHAKFSREYSRELRAKTLRTFVDRFFKNQFKRSCVPDGPKVGSVSLSPRGDWRMPSDAVARIWLDQTT